MTLLALFLMAFYTGTLRNVAAGEPDDMAASLLFAVGVLVWLDRRSAAAAGLVMGCAFLFKFWALIFFGGFALFLLVRRDWWSAGAASAAFALPFLCLSLVDAGASLAGFLMTARRVRGQSTWPLVGLRLVVTGILPAFLAAGWVALRRPSFENVLAFTAVPAPYLLHILVMQDAHAVTFVMMLCLVFWSFPIAELLLGWQALAGRPWLRRVALAMYADRSARERLAQPVARHEHLPHRPGIRRDAGAAIVSDG